MTKNDQNFDIFDLDSIENHKKWRKMTKHVQNFDIFDLDCIETLKYL